MIDFNIVLAGFADAFTIYNMLFVLFGVILGCVAILLSQKARKDIELDPTYTGKGLAVAGLVLGIIGVVGHLALILMR